MKALFLGLGGVGQRHMRNLRAIEPNAEFAAVRHRGRRFEITPELEADETVDIENQLLVALEQARTEEKLPYQVPA